MGLSAKKKRATFWLRKMIGKLQMFPIFIMSCLIISLSSGNPVRKHDVKEEKLRRTRTSGAAGPLHFEQSEKEMDTGAREAEGARKAEGGPIYLGAREAKGARNAEGGPIYLGAREAEGARKAEGGPIYLGAREAEGARKAEGGP